MSIRKVQCINGHFFDGNRYEVCPLCQAPEKQEVPSATANSPSWEREEREESTPEKGGMFDFLHRKKKNEEINIPDDKTIGLGEAVTAAAKSVPQKMVPEAEKQTFSEPVAAESLPVPSLSRQVETRANTLDAKTTGRYTTEETEPVVGWLVSVKGVSQGLSFELNDGKNSIGRMRTNKVALETEPGVSREKHAYVIFDSKNNVFYLQAGESDKMTYLNNSPVLMPQTMKAYDKIQLGDCELIFVPLCCESFTWDSYIE